MANRDEANEIIQGTIIDSGKFYYTYLEYRMTHFLLKCCCCCMKREWFWWRKRLFRYERYEKAVKSLNKEIDIVKHVSNLRTSQFIAKLILRKH